MKTKLITILLVILLVAGCSEENPGPQMGCMTGVPKVGDPVRTFIRCCTQEDFYGGSNPAAGGTTDWNYYTDHEWKAVSDCDKCK